MAFGADYRLPASPWHVSFDVRFGAAKSKSQFFKTSFTTEAAIGPVTSQFHLTEHESHAVGDFMIGRDVGFGQPIGLNQVKIGVRVADLEAKVHADAQSYAVVRHTVCVTRYSCTTVGIPAAAAVSADERSHFLGIGPRLAAEGSMPLGGPWAVDYTGGVAVLFGDRKLDVTGTAVSSDAIFGFGPTPPFAFQKNFSDNKGVFNADASVALAYWFTPRAKLSAGFRFDGYWKALKTFDAAGNVANVDRFYYGPFVRLTGNELPEIKHVAHTNFCDIGWRVNEPTRQVVLVSCIDNLIKGAAGQAVQNFNVAFGFDERLGLS